MTYPQMLARLALDLLDAPRTITCPCCAGARYHDLGAELRGADTITPERRISCGCCDGEGKLAACPSCREGVLSDGKYCRTCAGDGTLAGLPCEAQQ